MTAAIHTDRETVRVAVMMGVYNGAAFLGQQIESLMAQTLPTIDIWASDDGSTDASREILGQAAGGWQMGSFNILAGPARGFCENFRSLMVNPKIEADHFAFCDQDDVWDTTKLERAVAWLSQHDPALPGLYCSRTRTIDETGHPIGSSPLFEREPTFRNAIVQSIAGANTMVMNRAARRLIAEAARRTDFVSHDWWCYQIVTGAGGIVHYDPVPGIGYRQHSNNVVGSNSSLAARFRRLRFLVQGGFARWTDRNIAGLKTCEDLLTPASLLVLNEFDELRKAPLLSRLKRLSRSGLYRQTQTGQFMLYVSCALGLL